MSDNPKKASDHIPYAKDQGMDYLAAAGQAGVGIQGLTYTMASGGVIVFADQGLVNMASATYQVLVQNQTDAADEATISAKSVTGFTITGPDVADVLDIVIVGQLSGQTA